MSITGGDNFRTDAAGVVHVGAGLGVGDAVLLWEEADPNAEALLLGLPAADGTVVPVWIIGLKSLVGVDLGIFNGVTEPKVVLYDKTGTKYISLAHHETLTHWQVLTVPNQRLDFGGLEGMYLAANTILNPDNTLYLGGGLTFQRPSNVTTMSAFGTLLNNPIVFTIDANKRREFSKGLVETNPRIFLTSVTSFLIAVNEYLSFMHDTIDALIGAGKGKMRIVSDEHNGASTNFGWASATVASAAGPTLTLAGLIPPKKNLLFLTSHITTALGATSGCTGFTVGDGVDADRWGVQPAITLGATTDSDDSTADPTDWFAAAQDVVLTALTGDFDADGAVEVVAHYLDGTAPTS